jgi:hypothetical protein
MQNARLIASRTPPRSPGIQNPPNKKLSRRGRARNRRVPRDRNLGPGRLQRRATYHGVPCDGPAPVPRSNGLKGVPRPKVGFSGRDVARRPRCGLRRRTHTQGGGRNIPLHGHNSIRYCNSLRIFARASSREAADVPRYSPSRLGGVDKPIRPNIHAPTLIRQRYQLNPRRSKRRTGSAP